MNDFNLENTTKISSGFKIPENYFEQFEVKMMQHILDKNNSKKEAKVVSLFHKKQIWISSIAAIFLVAIAIPIYFNMAKENSLDSITIEHYLAEQQSIGTTELTKQLTDEDITALETSLGVSISENDEIEAYLLETDNLEYILNE
jgi:hypothetical protein